MMTDTPHFIEPDDVNGRCARLPIFVTRTTLLAMIEDAAKEQKPATNEFAAS
jgi:hypothetical protein